jgi:cephalosporin hydroxylase
MELFSLFSRSKERSKGRPIRRVSTDPESEQQIVERFHRLYYDAYALGETWGSTFWLGVKTQKCPLDLWVYQEIIHELKPDVIIETGTLNGGSALFLASMCDLMARGAVITIDVNHKKELPTHPRIKYLLGSSISDEIVRDVRSQIREGDTVMVILDSDHRRDHVLSELRTYGALVSRGSYLIVEDTNINGNPVFEDFGPGPMEAVEDFLRETKDFVVDREKEKFYLTFNPCGYLRKVR